MAKITVELEVKDISKEMVLFEHVGEIADLEMCRTVPLGSPIVYAPDGKTRYMIKIEQVYQALAREILEGCLSSNGDGRGETAIYLTGIDPDQKNAEKEIEQLLKD